MPIKGGLIYKTDFDLLNDWVNDGSFSSVIDNALIAFDPLPNSFNRTIGGTDSTGVREATPLLDDSGNIFLLYDGGDGIKGWNNHLAISPNGARTWVKTGIIGPGHAKGGGGTHKGSGMGCIYKENGYYYFFRLWTDYITGDIPTPPYYGDIWKSSSINGPWTFIRELPIFAGTWAHSEVYPGSVIKVGATYYFFVGAKNSLNKATAGIYTSNSIEGAWSLVNNVILDSTKTGDLRTPENPKIFYHPVFGKYVLLNNLISSSGAVTDQSCIQISPSISDWSAASLRRIQSLNPMDAQNATGVIAPLVHFDGSPIIGTNNFVPAFYDCGGINSPGYHIQRAIKTVMLEPSLYTLRFNGAAFGKILKPLSNKNFVSEFGIQFSSYNVGEWVSFSYRSNDTGTNQYRLKIRNGGDKMQLTKVLNGIETIVGNGSGNVVTAPGMIHRIKTIISGTSHKMYIDGEPQIDVIDESLTDGTHIGFCGVNAAGADIRLLHLRTGNTVKIVGLPENSLITLMADGDIAVSSGLANNLGEIEFTNSHFPFSKININGVNFNVNNGIWGGDILSFENVNPVVNQLPPYITGAVVSENSIQLNIAINSLNQDGHKIYISTDGVNYGLHGTILGSTITYLATGLSSNTNYYFKAVAYKGIDFSIDSNVFTKSTWNLIGLWHLEEGAGTNANDETANNNDITLANGVAWGVGSVGNYCLSFDGTNDYAETQVGALLKNIGVGDFAIKLKFKINVTGRNDLFVWKNEAGTADIAIYVDAASTAHAGLTISGVTIDVLGITVLTSARWYNLILQRKNGMIEMFLDDNFERSIACPLNLSSHTSNRVWLGSNHTNFVPLAAYNLNGYIDEMMIYQNSIVPVTN